MKSNFLKYKLCNSLTKLIKLILREYFISLQRDYEFYLENMCSISITCVPLALSLGSRKKRETCIRTPLFPPQNPSNYQLKTLNLTCKETFFLFYFIWQFLLSYVLEIFFLNLLLLLCLELIFFRVFVCFLN